MLRSFFSLFLNERRSGSENIAGKFAPDVGTLWYLWPLDAAEAVAGVEMEADAEE